MSRRNTNVTKRSPPVTSQKTALKSFEGDTGNVYARAMFGGYATRQDFFPRARLFCQLVSRSQTTFSLQRPFEESLNQNFSQDQISRIFKVSVND